MDGRKVSNYILIRSLIKKKNNKKVKQFKREIALEVDLTLKKKINFSETLILFS